MAAEMQRRDFLKGTAWMGALALSSGCRMNRLGFGTGGAMQDFALQPMKRIRVGFVGIGKRGTAAVHRVSMLPGVDIVALCDLKREQVEMNLEWLKEHGYPAVPRAYCLQNGIPLDMDVYDLAVSSCICELTETSVRNRSKAMDIPDFTRGAWRTTKPQGILSCDLSKINLDRTATDNAALNV